VHTGAPANWSVPMIEIRKANALDVPLIFDWENDPQIWSITDEPGPFSMEDIRYFIVQQNDLLVNGQERWLICLNHQPIGMMDLFQWNLDQRSVGLGIVLMEMKERSQGYGSQAIQCMEHTLKEVMGVNTIWVLVWEQNTRAMNFFLKMCYHRKEDLLHMGKKAIKFEKKMK